MINYPLGFKAIQKEDKKTSYKSRGMSFESRINKSNDYYKENKIAIIKKRPTPIKVIKVDRSSNTITKAVFEEASTTDYNGIYKGKYIDFEAKSTISKTSFPLQNLEKHQYDHLEEIYEQRGISFLIIEFSKIDEIYILPFEKLKEFVFLNKRKSLPIEYIKENGEKVYSTIKVYVDYLEAVDKLFKIS